MNISFDRAELHLGTREVIRLHDPIGARIECVRGELWITQDKDFEDHFLAANEALTLDRAGLAIVHAHRESEIVLFEPAQRARPGDRIRLALAEAARAAGRWFARTFGPASIDRPHPGSGLGAL
jgi:Protein of unknown function (DUF2917)